MSYRGNSFIQVILIPEIFMIWILEMVLRPMHNKLLTLIIQ